MWRGSWLLVSRPDRQAALSWLGVPSWCPQSCHFCRSSLRSRGYKCPLSSFTSTCNVAYNTKPSTRGDTQSGIDESLVYSHPSNISNYPCICCSQLQPSSKLPKKRSTRKWQSPASLSSFPEMPCVPICCSKLVTKFMNRSTPKSWSTKAEGSSPKHHSSEPSTSVSSGRRSGKSKKEKNKEQDEALLGVGSHLDYHI